MLTKEVIIGVDIGGTNTALGVVDASGQILHRALFPTRKAQNADDFIVRLADSIKKLQQKLSQGHVLRGIGIAAPTANYFRGTIEGPANLQWGEVELVKKIKSQFDLPVALTNDGNAAALGEMHYGAARDMKNFVVITLGTGLGSGIVVDGRLVYGENGLAGELGHVAIDPDGRECACGRTGCLETYVSAPGLCRTAFTLLAERIVPSELRNYSPNVLTARKVYELALMGDAIALAAFDYTGQILGQALANTVSNFSPEAIILFGGLAEAGEFLFAPTQKYFERYLLNIYRGRVRLLKSRLQNGQAAILGASLLVANEIA